MNAEDDEEIEEESDDEDIADKESDDEDEVDEESDVEDKSDDDSADDHEEEKVDDTFRQSVKQALGDAAVDDDDDEDEVNVKTLKVVRICCHVNQWMHHWIQI